MAEDLRNHQQFAQDVAAAAAAGDGAFANLDGGAMPSVEEVLKLIDSIDSFSAEERQNLRESLLNPLGEKAQQLLKSETSSNSDYVVFFSMIAVIVFVFALFGYKLYKSLMEKELKKQEKQKLKQSKKAKKAN